MITTKNITTIIVVSAVIMLAGCTNNLNDTQQRTLGGAALGAAAGAGIGAISGGSSGVGIGAAVGAAAGAVGGALTAD